jgi:imidazolonepropionase-like amidohydrolase
MRRLPRTDTLALCGALLAGAATLPAAGAQPAAGASPLILAGVTVVDVATGARRPGETVVIAGGRIVAVGAAGRVRTPASAQRVDARGKLLIPGLWDMDAHLMQRLPPGTALYLANGVTGVREMGNQQLDSLRTRLE